MAGILFKDESYRIMGAMFEVYKEMGCGFLEPVYQECVEFELADQKVPFVAQIQLELKYKHHQLKSKYIPDAICYAKLFWNSRLSNRSLINTVPKFTTT